MAETRAKIFKLLESADNFLKYAAPGKRERAVKRARQRYEKAAGLARTSGDEATLAQVELRLADLDRANEVPEDIPDEAGAKEPDYRGIVTASAPAHSADRTPPGQRLTRGWPTLHVGGIPRFDASTWTLSIDGAVGRSLTLSYEELKAVGPIEMRSDFHCVTGWSKLDNVWTGVRTNEVLELAEPQPGAAFVTVGDAQGYTANLPLEVLLDADSLLAWGHNGVDLAPKHGFPLRLVVPRLYGWKSVKWVRKIELTERDTRGFWELRGYHNDADPWLEQRYSYQE